jgi:lysophospholipase L1-like esterase
MLTKKLKIFFVGDSFTDGCGVKTEYMYFSIVKNNLDAEVFAYGGKGYGTLQEYLVIDRYIDEIKPDLIILQACANDFINNVWTLESASYLNNNDMLRPYFENGRIQYRFPRGPVLLKKYVIPHSRLAYCISKVVNRSLAALAKKGIIKTIENEITERGIELGQFKQSVLVTSELVDKLKKRCDKISLLAFSVDDTEPYFSQFRLMFKNKGIEFIEGIPKIIYEANMQGNKLLLKSGHWNKDGHEIIGEYLAEYIKRHIFNVVTNKYFYK